MTDIVERINQGIGDGWKALAKEAAAEIERLRSLRADVVGCWSEYETKLRQIMGHTNYNVVARKLEETAKP